MSPSSHPHCLTTHLPHSHENELAKNKGIRKQTDDLNDHKDKKKKNLVLRSTAIKTTQWLKQPILHRTLLGSTVPLSLGKRPLSSSGNDQAKVNRPFPGRTGENGECCVSTDIGLREWPDTGAANAPLFTKLY